MRKGEFWVSGVDLPIPDSWRKEQLRPLPVRFREDAEPQCIDATGSAHVIIEGKFAQDRSTLTKARILGVGCVDDTAGKFTTFTPIPDGCTEDASTAFGTGQGFAFVCRSRERLDAGD